MREQIIKLIDKNYNVEEISEVLSVESQQVIKVMKEYQPVEEFKHDWRGVYGELEYCLKCGALEGSTPTDCPGEPMSADVSDKVYAGGYDFREGEGWVNKLSPMGQSTAYSILWDITSGRREREQKSASEVALYLGVPMSEIKPILNDIHKHVLTGNK